MVAGRPLAVMSEMKVSQEDVVARVQEARDEARAGGEQAARDLGLAGSYRD